MSIMRTYLDLRLVLFLVGLSGFLLQALGGRPPWPPPKHSAEYRQANLLFLQFQEALATERWDDALALCSERVRKKAAEWSSAKAFLNDTIPVDLLQAQSFGYWSLRSAHPTKGDGYSDRAEFYGLLVPLTAPEVQPVLQWYWGVSATKKGWVVDYPPVKLQEHMAKKKAAIEERDKKLAEIRQSLEPKVKGIKTRVVPVSERFVAGAPMLFRVEVANNGKTPVDYTDSGVAFFPLKVVDAKGKAVAATVTPAQIGMRRGKVAPGVPVVLAEKIDLNTHYQITRPGQYVVEFNGEHLQVGQAMPSFSGSTPGPFGENSESMRTMDFVAATNRFPSEPVTIEVVARK